MKALASLPDICSFFPLFLEKYTRLQDGDIRYPPLLPEFFMRCFAPGKTDWSYRWDSTTRAEVTLCDPANGTGCTGGIITVEISQEKKTPHCCIDLFYQFMLVRVSRAVRGQGKPWQYLKGAIKAHGRRSVKGKSCWMKPKDCITSLQRSPQTPKWVTMALTDPTTNAICQVLRTHSVTIYRIKQ